ncbi:MAG: GNAT family N-acetyltransferase [Pseudooceanicola sp.]
MTDVAFRTARDEDEIALMLDWAAAEGWNPGLADASAFFAADPDGFFLAEHAGVPVAAISVVNHSAAMAFLGLYLCLPEYRGRGIGFSLWNHALDHAGDRVVGLDGVAAQEANYARSGFRRTGSSRRFEGSLDALPDARIEAAAAEDMPRLQDLDRRANGYARPAFLATWLAPSETRRTVLLRRAGDPAGFATLRRCRDGVKVGPVVADHADEALALIRAGLDLLPAGRVIVDLPSESADLEALLRGHGFVETFATARMYRGTPPETGPTLQAIATMELG